MLKKNLTIAFRSLKKNLFSSVINLAGLTIGITCCLLIFSFVNYELSFDQFHSRKDHIYRLNYDVLMGGNQQISPSVPVFVGPEVKKRFPEVEDATRFSNEWVPRTIRYKDVFFDETKFAYADPNFFNVLDFKSIQGDPTSALKKPNSLIITKKIADKYFGKENPIGKILTFNNKKDYEVAAVVENIPGNSHFSFNFLTSHYSIAGFDSLETRIEWNNPNYTTFLLLKPGTNIANLEKKFEDWMYPPNEKVSEKTLHLKLEPLKKVHFNTDAGNFGNELAITDFKYITIFLTIAILVLLIACANYINLATAKAANRAKEVGIRKVAGATFSQLVIQFLTESFLLILPSIIISILAVYLLLPQLNQLLDKPIPFPLFERNFLLGIAGGWLLFSLLAGFYPALVLSRFKPVETLKGGFAKTGGSGLIVRKSLVVFQFVISALLIVGTLIIYSQLDFMQSKKLGLDKEQVVLIRGNADLTPKLSGFANDLRNINGVENTALTWRSPFETVIGNGFSLVPNSSKSEDWHLVGGIAGDPNYLSTLGIALVTGKNFDPAKINGDSTINEFIVNEAFLRHYNLKPDEVVGREVILGMTGGGKIVGVMKDFHTSSMRTSIEPVVLFNQPGYSRSILLRINGGKVRDVLAAVENKWKAELPNRPFNYSFLDDQYDAMYRTEQRAGTLMSIFCGMAILIACLGLFGLASFMVAQRTKEIGIRKVLGATTAGLVSLLSKDFLKLVIISLIIAMPVGWYLMNTWLQDFAYRVHIGWLVFIVTATVALSIALLTVSLQAIRAALANPIKALKTE